jgi:hypothetical protein
MKRKGLFSVLNGVQDCWVKDEFVEDFVNRLTALEIYIRRMKV